MAFDQIQYQTQYNKTHYKRLQLVIPKGAKADIQKTADDYGVSLTQLAISAIEQKYGVSLTESKPDFNG